MLWYVVLSLIELGLWFLAIVVCCTFILWYCGSRSFSCCSCIHRLRYSASSYFLPTEVEVVNLEMNSSVTRKSASRVVSSAAVTYSSSRSFITATLCANLILWSYGLHPIRGNCDKIMSADH